MKWKCIVCDYVYEGDWPPNRCPRCAAKIEKFVKVDAEPIQT